MENCLELFSIATHIFILWPSNPTPRYVHKRNECVCLLKIHRGAFTVPLFYKSQKLEPILMYFNRMNNWIVGIFYNWTIHTKKEKNETNYWYMQQCGWMSVNFLGSWKCSISLFAFHIGIHTQKHIKLHI